MKNMNPNSADFPLQELLGETAWAQGLASSLVGAQGADDLLQETWAQAVASFPGEALRSPRAWFATLMRRRAYSRSRSERHRVDRELLVACQREQAPADVLLAREEKRAELIQALMALRPASSEVLVLRFFEELTPAAIAKQLGIPASTVRSRLQRGLDEMRANLEAQHGDDWQAWCVGILPAGWKPNPASASSWLLGKWMIAAAGLLVFGGGWWAWEIRSAFFDASSHESELAAQVGVLSEPSGERPEQQESAPTPAADRVAVVAPTEKQSAWLPLESTTRFYMLRGLCLDEDRKPVPDMTVTAFNLKGMPSVKSDRTGRFALPITDLRRGSGPLGIDPDEYLAEDVRIVFEGSTHRARFQRIDFGDAVEIDMGVVGCETAPHTIRGRVLDSLGLPVEKALVGLVLNVPQQIDLKEYFRTSISGDFIYPIGGLGLIQTERDGSFAIRGVPPQHWRVAIFHNGHDGFLADLFELKARPTHDLGEIQLNACKAEAAISGRVLTPGGQPASDVFVVVRAFYSDETIANLPMVITDASGRFLAPVPPGTKSRVKAVSPEGAVQVEGIGTGTEDLELLLVAREPSTGSPDPSPRGQVIGGRVRLNGEPIAGAWISCFAVPSHSKQGGPAPPNTGVHGDRPFATGRSTDQGIYEIAVPPGGSFTVIARAGSPTSFAGVRHLVETDDQEPGVQHLDLELHVPGQIAGRVDGPSGSSKPGAMVHALHEDGTRRSAAVGADNLFRFENVKPGGWQLSHDSATKSAEAGRLEVAVQSGQTGSAVLRLAGELVCDVSGRFLIDGKPPETAWTLGALVDLKRLNANGLRASGEFRLDPAKPGTLRLQFLSRDKVFNTYIKHAQIAPGPNTVDVEITTGSLVLTKLPLPNKADLEGQLKVPSVLTWSGEGELKWLAHLLEARDGELTLDQVPVGTLQLRYTEEGSRGIPEHQPVVAEIQIRAGEQTHFSCPPR